MTALRVLEIGSNCAAGYAGKLFARWGAEVIRLEQADDGEAFPRRMEHRAVDAYLHAGKKHVAIDYMEPVGRALLDELAARVDILITDLSPAELEHLDWEHLGGPDLKVRAAVTPFGMDGPKRDWAAASNVLLAMGGQTFLMGDEGRAPLTMPGRYLYYQAGQFAYTAALASHRLDPKEAQTIDVSMYETAMSLHQFTTVMWTFGASTRGRHGNDFSALHPITMYPCKDGWWAVNADALFWDPFTIMLGMPELIVDPRFADIPSRLEHRKELDAIVIEQFSHLTRREILDLGQEKYRVPTGILTTIRELLDDRHLAERDFWQSISVDGRELKVPGSSFRYVGEAQPAQAGMAERHDAATVLAEWDVHHG